MLQVRPFGYRTFFLQPFVPEGKTQGGVWIVHHKSIPAIFGRVTAAHESCLNVRVGDWVVYQVKRPVLLKWSGGRVYALREEQILGIVLPGDLAPWFAPSKEGGPAHGNGVLQGVSA